jgi:transposase-like protein
MAKINYEKICIMLAAKNCYESGMPIKEIARQAKVSISTVRRWLRHFPR